MLPDSGSMAFFVPFLEINTRHSAARQMQRDICCDAELINAADD